MGILVSYHEGKIKKEQEDGDAAKGRVEWPVLRGLRGGGCLPAPVGEDGYNGR